MTSKEWAINEIKRDRENIQDLKEARHEAWCSGDRKAWAHCNADIRDLSHDINAVMDAYHVTEEDIARA